MTQPTRLPAFSDPETLVSPPGPYSQVVRVGDLVFVSGQVGVDSDGVLRGDGILEQADQALTNVRLALESQGLGLRHVVKVTIFLAHPDDLEALVPHMDRVFPALFPAGCPASSLVIVQRLVDAALRIEIEAIAHA
ncbi:MAG: RidA family protein [Nocardioides sp.]|uniref:RidA family protein n=1 Tax=Nocardioides sp. TaxID=35761 RepID=UPI0039E23F1E